MKIGIISDLHLDNPDLFKHALIKVVNKKKVDILLIAGDISEDVRVTIKFIDEVNKDVMCYYIVGNHDIWNKHNGLSLNEILSLYDSHKYCLLNKKIKVDDLTIIGSIGWFDYSYGNVKLFTEEQFKLKEHSGIIWQDKFYSNVVNDLAFFERNYQYLKKEVEQSEGDVLLLTHTVNHQRFTVKENHTRDWNYFNAFLGSRKYEELTKNIKVKYAVCGHVHYRQNFKENGIEYICRCLGNKGEYQYFLASVDLEEQMNDALYVITTKN